MSAPALRIFGDGLTPPAIPSKPKSTCRPIGFPGGGKRRGVPARCRNRVRFRLSRHTAQPRWKPDNRHDRRGPLSAHRSACRGIRHLTHAAESLRELAPCAISSRLAVVGEYLSGDGGASGCDLIRLDLRARELISAGLRYPLVTNRPLAPLRGRFVTSWPAGSGWHGLIAHPSTGIQPGVAL